MFNKVIVGIDGQEGGQDALALARLLLADGGQLTLAYVYPGDPFVWRGGNPAYHAVEADDAKAVLELTRREADVDAQLRYVGDPNVGRGLHVLAEDVGADLLVVGSSRRGLMSRVMMGDDTRAALNGAPCAVAVAPAGYAKEPKAMREIGVGYNGSPESEHALSVARELAREHGAKLSAFEVVSVPTFIEHGRSAVDGAQVGDLVVQARERIAALGGVEAHAAYGRPPEELALYSASLDLLVLGSRDYGPIGRLVHGSTSQDLARMARCPLLVLTRAARRAEVPEPTLGEPQGALAGQ
ncbi:MAG TPA: universal stress protein [Solirubrobacteraceae bacterium]|nr:universal stress protein [Solirubrobacteraceae bacterium]